MIVINSNSFDYNSGYYENKIIALINSKAKKMKIIYKDFNFIEDRNQLLELSNKNLVESSLIVNMLIEEKKLPFDILIIDLINNRDLNYHLIIKLFKYSKIKDKELIIYNHYDSLPFHIKNIKKEEKQKQDIKINYQEKDFKIRDRKNIINNIADKISKINQKDIIILVIVPGLSESKQLYGKIKSLRNDNFEIYQLNENIEKTKFGRYIRKEKTNILIMESDSIIPLPYQNIEIIYDCYMYSNNRGKFNYLYKEHLNLLKTYLNKGEINLMITKNFFDNSPIFGVPIMTYKDTYKYYLKILRNNIFDPDLIFTDIINDEALKRIKKTLKTLNIINGKRILLDEEFLFSIPLNLRPAFLIFKVIESKKELPLFPFIVLASIIEIIKYINEEINFEDPLIFYLEKWILFSKNFKKLNVDKEKLKEWCSKNNLNYFNFNNLIDKIIELYTFFSLKYEVTIGIFNIDNLMKKAIKFLERAYKEYVFHIKLKEKDNHIYTNNKEEAIIKRYLDYKYPEKVISFSQKRNYNEGLDQIIFYTILEN